MNGHGYWAALLATAVVSAGAANATEVRTASWFADHAHAREQVTEICRDNPGQARSNPNCANASQGQILASINEAKRQSGIGAPPNTVSYWLANRSELPQRLAICDRASQANQEALYCPAARAARGM